MSQVIEPTIRVEFAEHLPPKDVAGMVSGLAAYGNVDSKDNERTYVVKVFRESKLPQLKRQLTDWERYGFMRWEEHG